MDAIGHHNRNAVHNAAPVNEPEVEEADHRARHLANAREWLRRFFAVTPQDIANGVSDEAIFDAFLVECKHGNLDSDELVREYLFSAGFDVVVVTIA